MKRAHLAVIFAGMLALFGAVPASASLPTHDSQGQELPSLAPMLKKVLPAVVNISTQTRIPVKQNPLLADPFFRQFFGIPNQQQPQEQYGQSLGSGVVVDAKHGYILTNNHVIDKAVSITVSLSDGRNLKAKLVGTDPAADVAVLKVKAKGLTALPLGNSSDLRVGDFVVAVGNPFGLGQTATSGIVSAKGRSGLGIEGYEDFIQTDASINPGNSGGALVNLNGKLMGINTAILSRSGGNIGIGFAIPINMAREVMGQLIKYGHVRRGQLGAQAQDLTPKLASAFDIKQQRGAVITAVTPHSAAAKAGLKSGDVVTRVNGKLVRNAADVRNIIGMMRVGQKVSLGIMRDGKPMEIHAVIAEPEMVRTKGQQLNSRLSGAELSNIVQGSPLYGKVKGVLLTKVQPGSPAWSAGLRAGDVIVQANRHDVQNLDQLRKAIRGSKQLLLNIQRQGGALFVLLQ